MKCSVHAVAVAIVLSSLAAPAGAQATDPNAPQGQPVMVAPADQQPVMYAQPQYAQPAPAPMPVEKPIAPNVLYVEGLGNAGIYSLNYERLVIPELAVRVGFSYISLSASGGGASAKVSLLTIPIMANYLGIGNDTHHLELGLGLVLVNATGSSSSGAGSVSGSGFGAYGTATVGYRFQPLSGGFLFRAGFTPLFGSGGFQAWGGVSLGVSF